MIGKAEYSIFILQKLQKLESLSSKYEDILRLISKRIRRDLWSHGKMPQIPLVVIIIISDVLEIRKHGIFDKLLLKMIKIPS